MGQIESRYDGKLISELGVKRYLSAYSSLGTSNIDFFIRGKAAEKAWKECNFGCHVPTYRTVKRQSTYAEMLAPIHDASPFAAGILDGVRAQTIGQVEQAARGVRRTAEGLHLTGSENFSDVGDENFALYEFCRHTLESVFTFELDMLDNPFTQNIMLIVSEYMAVLPEWVVEEAFKSGAIKLDEKIDTAWLIKGAALGLIKDIGVKDLELAAGQLNSPTQRFAGKQIGKRIAAAMAVALAGRITKNILKYNKETIVIKRQLVRIRAAAKKMNGGLGTALLTLLKAQGLLDKAGQASRRLEISNPRIWRIMRYDLRGANMIYFLMENMVQEYIDRLTLLEKQPKEFLKVMTALIKDKQTPRIFIP